MNKKGHHGKLAFWPVLTVLLNMANKHSRCGFVMNLLDIWT